MKNIKFTFAYLREELQKMQAAGYSFINCEQFVELKKSRAPINKTVVLRVDVDFSVKKAEKLLLIFNELKIIGTFFIRLHAPEYNPFSFENYRIIKSIINSGHEIGYHSEIVDQAYIWNESPADCLIRDINIINAMFGITIKGAASHGGMTGYNNLSFWETRKPQDYNLLYEGYDKESNYNIFAESFYISDSEWIRWKCYNNGCKVENDYRPPSEHILDNHQLIHLLIHPDTYFNNNFYDNER